MSSKDRKEKFDAAHAQIDRMCTEQNLRVLFRQLDNLSLEDRLSVLQYVGESTINESIADAEIVLEALMDKAADALTTNNEEVNE